MDKLPGAFLAVCLNPALQKTYVFPALIPDRVNRTRQYRLDASGKGVNVSRVLGQLGETCRHLTQLGASLRPVFLELCARDGLDLVWVESHSPIRFCHTLIDEETGAVTELVEESEPVGEGTGERLMEAYLPLLETAGTVIFSGTKAAGLPGDLIPRMVHGARERGRRIILDIQGRDLLASLAAGPDLIKPNLYEFAATFAPELVSRNEVIPEEPRVRERVAEICRDLWERFHTQVVLSRGPRPVWYAASGELAEYPLEALPRPLNTTGSGDAFTAGLAAA
ncbi:MAG: PfkB family carbohydrate kinase, partial [Treponema sp.]|nr:PfkB family carbohydrate kinase [Treponema sp.]